MVVFCGKPLIQTLQVRPSKDLEKTNSCRHILKRSSNTFESWVSQFFKTTTKIQSGTDTFYKSRLCMTFLTKIRVVRKFLTKNCALSDAEGNTSGLLSSCSITLLRPVLATCCKSQEPSFCEAIKSFVLLA